MRVPAVVALLGWCSALLVDHAAASAGGGAVDTAQEVEGVVSRQMQHQRRTQGTASAVGYSSDITSWDPLAPLQHTQVEMRRHDEPAKRPETCAIRQGFSACLPAFLVIGAQKSGTSTLAHLMDQHPQIKKPKAKELLFFNWNNDFKIKCNPSSRELAEYFAKFPKIQPAAYRREGLVSGEYSATYLPCHCCAQAVHRVMPQVRVIAILRHPIDRAHSRFVEQGHFAKQYKKREINNCPVWMGWDRFVDHAIGKLRTCFSQIQGQDEGALRECIHHNNEVGWSIYAPSLKEWIARFGRPNVQVVFTDHLKTDPLGVLRAIEQHVGVNHYHKYQDVNTTLNAKGKYGWNNKDNARDRAAHPTAQSKMAQPTYDKLYEFYAPFMMQLQRMAVQRDIASLPQSWVDEWGL